ncbi:unnamed protein product [Urochloa humidicola]
MAFPREQTPHPRRRHPTIPLPASRVAVNAMPFSPRSSPPPSATPTAPPTPLNLPPFTSAFDPLGMLASSSSGPAVAQQVHGHELKKAATSVATPPKPVAEEEGPFFLGDLFKEMEDKGKGLLGAKPKPVPCQIPKARDIRMVGHVSSAAASSPARAPGPIRSPRSPPSPPSPAPPAPPTVNQTAPSEAEDEELNPEQADDEEVEESVESDDLADGPEYVEIWVDEGDWDRASRCVFVQLEPLIAAANPAPLIRAAFQSNAPGLRFQMLPSSRGVALLHFNNADEREEAMELQPLLHQGTQVQLERVEDTDDRFLREPEWLAQVVVWNFPKEHWYEEKVREIYDCIGTVMEIDHMCIPGFDRSCMRFVIELCHPHVPYRVGVHPRSGRGIVLRQNALSYWPRANQFDENGNWIPFFGPPPPPPATGQQAPQNGPAYPLQPFIGPQPPPPSPAFQGHQPIQPGAFMGATILYHGFFNAFPLPPLPTLPILLHVPQEPIPAPRALVAVPMLLLTWHSPSSTPMNDQALPLASPPTPASPPPAALPDSPPLQQHTRMPRHRNTRAPSSGVQVRSRNSERLAAKENGRYVAAADKASQLKALQNSLALCSKPVQLHVTKKKLLKKTKKPIAAADLVKLSEVVGLGEATAKALDQVMAIGAATAEELDQVLAGRG